MKSFLRSAAVLSGAVAVSSMSLFAQTDVPSEAKPTALLTVDGVGYEIPVRAVEDRFGKLTYETDSAFSLGSEELGFKLESVFLSMDPDPSIIYAVAVLDFGAPSVFGFYFSTPIVPVGPLNIVRGSISGSVVDSGSDGAEIIAVGGPDVQVANVLFAATNMGVDVGPSFVGNPGVTTPYGDFTEGFIPGPGPGPWTGLEIYTTFTTLGGGDGVTLSGKAEIYAVPEASTTAAAGFLGLALGGVLWRRRAAR